MRKNMDTRISGTNVILVPYQEKHVTRYHEWMKNPTLQYLTSSEPLTLDEEFRMQKRWLEDKDITIAPKYQRMMCDTNRASVDVIPLSDNVVSALGFSIYKMGMRVNVILECTYIILDKHVYLENGNEEDAMVGDTNLFLHDLQGSCVAEIEIMIAEEANRGRRRGWESVILMLLYGIKTLNINKFCAKIKLDNAVSIRMFEKLGFQEVERSEVFQEVTLEKETSSDWINWLHSELESIMSN